MLIRSISQFLPSERISSLTLAGLFAIRMLGLFLLLPVFSVSPGQPRFPAAASPPGAHSITVEPPQVN